MATRTFQGFETDPLSHLGRAEDFTFTQDQIDRHRNDLDTPFDIDYARSKGFSDAEVAEYLGYDKQFMAYQRSAINPPYEPYVPPQETYAPLPQQFEEPQLEPANVIQEMTNDAALGIGEFVVNKLTSGSLMLGQLPFTLAEITSNAMGLNNSQFGRVVAEVNQSMSNLIQGLRERDSIPQHVEDGSILPSPREVMGVILEAIPQALGAYATVGKTAMWGATKGLQRYAPKVMAQRPPIGPTLMGPPAKLGLGTRAVQKAPQAIAGMATSGTLGGGQIYNEAKQDALGVLNDLNQNLFETGAWLNPDQVNHTATKVAMEAFTLGMPVSTLLGVGLAPGFNPAVGRIRRGLVTGLTESLTEGLEEPAQGAIIDNAMISLDASRDPADFNKRLREFILGAFAGGSFGAVTGFTARRDKVTPRLEEEGQDLTPEGMGLTDDTPPITPVGKSIDRNVDEEEGEGVLVDSTQEFDETTGKYNIVDTPKTERQLADEGKTRYAMTQGFIQELDAISPTVPDVTIPEDVSIQLKEIDTSIRNINKQIKESETDVEKEKLGLDKQKLQKKKASIKPETRSNIIKRKKQEVVDKYDELFQKQLPDEPRDVEGRIKVLTKALREQNKKEKETAIDEAALKGEEVEQSELEYTEDEDTTVDEEPVVDEDTTADGRIYLEDIPEDKRKTTRDPIDRIQAHEDIVNRFPEGQSYSKINNLFERYSKAHPQNRGNILKKIEVAYAKLGLTPSAKKKAKKKEPKKKPIKEWSDSKAELARINKLSDEELEAERKASSDAFEKETKPEPTVTPPPKKDKPVKKEVVSPEAKKIFEQAGLDEDTTVDEPTADEPITPEQEALTALDTSTPPPKGKVFTEAKKEPAENIQIKPVKNPPKGKPKQHEVVVGKGLVGEMTVKFDNKRQADLYKGYIKGRDESNEINAIVADFVREVDTGKHGKTKSIRENAIARGKKIAKKLERRRALEDATALAKLVNNIPYESLMDSKGNIIPQEEQAAVLMRLAESKGGFVAEAIKMRAEHQAETDELAKKYNRARTPESKQARDEELSALDRKIKALDRSLDALRQFKMTSRGKIKEEMLDADASQIREVEKINKSTLRQLSLINNWGVPHIDKIFEQIEEGVQKLTKAIKENRGHKDAIEEAEKETNPDKKTLQLIETLKRAANLSSNEIDVQVEALTSVQNYLSHQKLLATRQGKINVDVTLHKKALAIVEEYGDPKALANNKTLSEMKSLAKSFKIKIQGDSKVEIAKKIFEYPTGRLSWVTTKVGRKYAYEKKKDKESGVYKGENAFKFVVYRKGIIEKAFMAFKKNMHSIEQNLKNKYEVIEHPRTMFKGKPLTRGKKREIRAKALKETVNEIIKAKFDIGVKASQSGIDPKAIFAEIDIESMVDNDKLRKELAKVKTATMHVKKLSQEGDPANVIKMSPLANHLGSNYHVDLDEMIETMVERGIEHGRGLTGEAEIRDINREQYLIDIADGKNVYQDEEGNIQPTEDSVSGDPFIKKITEEGDLHSSQMRPDYIFKFPEGTGAIAQNIKDAKARLIKYGTGNRLKIVGMGSLSRASLTNEKLNRATKTEFKDGEEGHVSPDGSIRLNVSIGGKLKSEHEVASVMRESRIIMGALQGMPSKATLYAEHIQTGDMDTIKLYIGHVSGGYDFAYIELKDGEVVHRHLDMNIVKYYAMQTQLNIPFDFLGPDKYAEGEPAYLESTQNAIDQAFTRAIGIVLHNRSTTSGLNQIAKDRDALSKSVGKEGKAEMDKWENKTIKRIGGTNVYVKHPITTKEEDQFWEEGQSNSLRDVMDDENNFGLFTNEDLGCK